MIRFLTRSILFVLALDAGAVSAQGNSGGGGGGNQTNTVVLSPDTTQAITIVPSLATTTQIPFERYATFTSQFELTGRNNDIVSFSISYPSVCTQVFGEYRALFSFADNSTSSIDTGVLAGVRVYDQDSSLIYQEGLDGFANYIQDFSRTCAGNNVTLTYNNFQIRNANSNTFNIEFSYDNNGHINLASSGVLMYRGADGEPSAGSYNLTVQVELL